MNRVEPPPPGTGLASSTVPPGPISWPPGVTAAACLTFDMDAEAAVLTADISSISRMTPMSHQSYGPLVGVPRILELLKRHKQSGSVLNWEDRRGDLYEVRYLKGS